MKDPLTKAEKRALLKNFVRVWKQKYQKILTCGALEDLKKHNHIPAKFALIFAAEEFGPFSPEHKKGLANLRHFI
jgi:hypothetical protein